MDVLSPETLKAINDLSGVAVVAIIAFGVLLLARQIVRGNTESNTSNSEETKVLLKLVADLITVQKGLDETLQTVRDSGREGTAVMETQAVILGAVRDAFLTFEKSARDHNIALVETVGTLAMNLGDFEKLFKGRTDEIVALLRVMPDDVAEIVKRHITAMLVDAIAVTPPKKITDEVKAAIIAAATATPPGAIGQESDKEAG